MGGFVLFHSQSWFSALLYAWLINRQCIFIPVVGEANANRYANMKLIGRKTILPG